MSQIAGQAFAYGKKKLELMLSSDDLSPRPTSCSSFRASVTAVFHLHSSFPVFTILLRS
jgi:hypothetical protein